MNADMQEEIFKLRRKLWIAESMRVSGHPMISVKESHKRLEDIFAPKQNP